MSHLHTYHCLCSTLLLATPYPLSTLPRRAPPSLDRAHILPLPPPPPPPPPPQPRPQTETEAGDAEMPNSLHMIAGPERISLGNDNGDGDGNDNGDGDGNANDNGSRAPLPSLLTPNLRPARKVLVVRREDGFEKRRVLRCGRCGVGVGYEVLREGGGEWEQGRVVYLMEGGLVETGEMGREGQV